MPSVAIVAPAKPEGPHGSEAVTAKLQNAESAELKRSGAVKSTWRVLRDALLFPSVRVRSSYWDKHWAGPQP